MMHHNPHVKNMEILNDEKKKENLEKACDIIIEKLEKIKEEGLIIRNDRLEFLKSVAASYALHNKKEITNDKLYY